MNGQLYHYSQLSTLDFGVLRSPGPGLGNLLFPLSRAIINTERHGGILVYPTMRQIKLGTLVRRERDSRTYGNILRSRSLEEWRHWAAAKLSRSVDETAFIGSPDDHKSVLGNQTVVYHGMNDYFHDLDGHHALLRQWLLRNTLAEGSVDGEYDIGIHVRLGDFMPTDTATDHHSVRLPLEWYTSAYHRLVSEFNLNNPRILLFTDENPEQVSKQLKIDSLELDPGLNAMTSILNLSRAKYIITSRSTFSMWAVYLGQTHAVWNESFNFEKSMPSRPSKDLIH